MTMFDLLAMEPAKAAPIPERNLFLLLPFSPCGLRLSADEWLAVRRRQGARYPDTTRLAMWTLKLMGSLLALMYLSAGWLKMVNGGLAWLDAFLDRVRHLISPVYFFRIPQSLSFSILGCAVRCLY